MGQRVEILFSLVVALQLLGCAAQPRRLTADVSTERLIQHLCTVATAHVSVEGRASLRVRTESESGRLNAWVQATREPASFMLEATDLLGRQAALITLKNGVMRIQDSKGVTRANAGSARWMGIPLAHATALLLGSPDCPKLESSAQIERHEADVIRIKRDRLVDELRFGVWEGQPWLSEWKVFDAKLTTRAILEVKYFDPDSSGTSSGWVVRAGDSEIHFWWRSRRDAEKSDPS